MQLEELQAVFNALIAQYKLTIVVNPANVKITELCSLDVEHDEAGGFVGCGIYIPSIHTVYYFSDLSLLLGCGVESLSLICHNGRTDFDVLRSWGINVRDEQLIFDTELISHIIDSSRMGYGLKKLAKEEVGIEYPSYDDIVGKRTLKQIKERRTLDKWPIDLVAKYNAMDCFATYKLYEQQKFRGVEGEKQRNLGESATQSGPYKYFEEIERPIAFILNDTENRGICVDLEYLARLKGDLENQKQPIENEIKNQLGNINLNSPKQLLEALNAKEIYPTFKGKASTDKRALENHKDKQIVQLLFKYSELDTLLSTFVKPYLERNESIVHPWFNQCGTRTGRLSCSNPNLLQIPKKTENGRLVRRMFIPRPGMAFGDCDFGQIEPRVMAHLSKDPVLCQMFNDGIDFHAFTAGRLSISRERAKVLNLSVGYRATKYSVQRQLGGSLDEAQIEIDKWWNLFPNLRRWQETILYRAKRSGFCETLMGRRIKVDGLSDGNPWKREAAERQLINNITQGSAAEIMKLAMINIAKSDDHTPGFGLLVQVYDELLFESPNIKRDIVFVTEHMRTCIELDVPLTVESKIGSNWADVK